jgi:predicted RNA-binding Zn-ribbon protein involved in translation (DUF1610 family)
MPDHMGSTGMGLSPSTTLYPNPAGHYCGLCGSKMYLSQDGSHYRCPNCDDAGGQLFTPYSECNRMPGDTF